VEPQARFAVTWRHVGLVQSIVATGHVDPRENAYFNWPGFFLLAGLLLRAAGLHDLLGVANWAPVVFHLLYLGPLVVILRALSDDRRVLWLGVWIFLAGDWVGQDYFSPQAFVLLPYLVVLAVLLAWLRRGPSGAPPPGPAARGGLVAIAILLFAAMVPSHQLTPFALLAAVALLVAGRCCAARGLPLTMLVILAVWLSYMTVGYLSGHSGVLLGQVGHLDTTLSENVSQRLQGDPGHVIVARARVMLTLALWALAVVGAWALRRAGHRDLAPVLLLGAPFVLVPLQPYGGEILLRVFLFSLPFTAFLAAAALRRAPPALTVALTLALLGGFLLTRYGNERMDWFSRGEVQAVDRLDALAPRGSTLVAWSSSLPWQARDYAAHRYRTVVGADDWPRIARQRPGGRPQLRLIAGLLGAQRGGAYLIITRSQKAEVDLTGLGPHGSLERVDAALRRSPAFRLLYANRDGSVYALRASRAAAGRRVEPAPTGGGRRHRRAP
jgi:hypothetical protein